MINLKKILNNFKKKLIYKLFVKYILKNIYDFIWQYILNFKGKILFFKWMKKNSNDYFCKNIPCEVINEKFETFSKEIKDQIDNNLIDKLKTKLISNEIIEDKKNIAANEMPFSVDLYPYLEENVKTKIVQFALNKNMISSVCHHLKVFPILAKVMVYLNIPRENSNERSAMLWHKDDFGYKSIDFFMSINEIDDDNGPFYYSVDPSDIGAFYRIKTTNELSRPGERGKIKNEDFFNYCSKKNIKKFVGKPGSAVFIDSMASYHKGGFCKKNDRIMLRFSYQTVDCIRLKNQKSKEFYYLKNLDKISFPQEFKDYIFFHRSSVFKNFVNNYLLKFYRLASITPKKIN